jgi:uncharacterized protein YutE (UPF0331/DUF86 family)
VNESRVREKVVVERAAWVRDMLAGIRRLPIGNPGEFAADPRNAAAAESFLRRALEALLDLGRHLLAKGFAKAVVEYKQVATQLQAEGVLSAEEADVLRAMAGYRNRIVHFYDEVGVDELLAICDERLGDIERVVDAILRWIDANPGRVDRS